MYKIIKSLEINKLETRVTGLMGQGWKPIGGTSVALTEAGNFCYVQAIVKDN